jgi:ABC-type uncharacterized transport system auxiliary subunit
MKFSLLVCVLAACALTSKAKPVEIRYFAPPSLQVAVQPTASSAGRARLGRITASSYLRARIAHRRSPVELDLADTLRWTEHPDEYVRRSLSRALFVDRGIEQAVTGSALTLTVEVTAFEHVERGGRHYGCVQLRYEIDDDNSVVTEGVVTVERDARGSDISLVVAAIGDALAAATADVADHFVHRMNGLP